METNQPENESANEDPAVTETEARRDGYQREQVASQAKGDTGGELKAFAREVFADQQQFPGDIAEDTKNPDRRVDEEQGTTTQPGSEPAEKV